MPAILDHAGDMPDPSLRTYLAGGGYRAWTRLGASVGGEEIVDIVERSGLTGKGGAGFPTHRKLRLMSAQAADKKYVVLNGSEHEPGSVKDRHLLEVYPHKVLEGALILALAVKASHVVVAINEVSAASTDTFCGALREAQADPDIDFAGISVQVRPVPDIYIVGEESALLEVLEGRKPQPRKKPPYPIQEGLYGFPTLIQNIETAAHLPFIMSAGADAYRALGIDGQ
ncbi:MAG: NADH-ubiquinone oxidoreductase chain, partial [Gammaproteobacteria bacterium]|nr:NADH-ubiquinone oxidoreductase chain [Gammaproteobacteria bacterium]